MPLKSQSNVNLNVHVNVNEKAIEEKLLSHERLEVYQCAIEFLALSVKIIDSLPRGNAVFSDQLKRAALSIPLNIAEGAGRLNEQDKGRFYGIARGSAVECGAILDACKVL
jgi:four helix bundle protein